jgi:SAM-dependent methyltransferase
MESLADLLDVQGVDIDPSMVRACLGRGLRASLADAMDLPFEDGSFDLVYCSFLLVWVDRPERAVQEMLRVSRDWVACLAEPDYAARIDHPPELSRLTSLIVEGARRQGGDPCLGRKLRSIFSALGANAEIGVHQGTWPLERLRQESAAEWEWMEGMIGDAAEEGELAELRVVWERALQEGSLLQCNPTFHALARKGAPLR